MPNALPIPDQLTVYGAPWCSDCRHTQQFLDRSGITYRYVDLEVDRDAQAMLDDLGYRAIPVVVTPDGAILIEPSARELAVLIGGAA